MRRLALLCPMLLLAACTTHSVVQLPTSSYPQLKPMLASPGDGGIFNPATARLFFETQIARHVGDAVTVSIEEDMSSSTSRALDDKATGANTVKGPGALHTLPGLVKEVFDVNVNSSYSLADKDDSKMNNRTKISGNMMVSVLDVLPNGYLVVGGDKVVLLNGKQSTLRFSGIINSAQLQPNNSISSRYVINARLDQINQNMPLDASVLAWVQFLFGAAVTLY